MGTIDIPTNSTISSSELILYANISLIDDLKIEAKVDHIDIEDFIKQHRYTDSYVAISGFDDVVLSTKNKFLEDDIKINKMNVSETSNPSGGYTLYIG